MDVKQLQNDVLRTELDVRVARLNVLAAELGPLLTEYGTKREEAEEIVKELKRRGALQEDG